MANTKISALTAASTPLAGTEVLPIVQSSATVKVAVSDLTAGRAVSAASLTLSGGTANGVAYLNGSKVVTAGTALTFDGSQLDIPLGSAGTPSLSTPTDPNTGLFFPTADTFGVAVGGTERIRVNANGYLKASNTGSYDNITGSFHELYQSTDARTVVITGNSASLSTDGIEFIYAARNTTNNSFYAISYYNGGAGAYKFRVADSGNVTNANNSYGAISDVKLKENIVDASPKLAALMQVKIRNYNLIGDTTKQLGVVAQELETVFPSMVDESLDKDLDGNDLGTTTKQVKYSVFVPILIKALQEAVVEIESLKTRLNAANL
jgi:hypothetical protein